MSSDDSENERMTEDEDFERAVKDNLDRVSADMIRAYELLMASSMRNMKYEEVAEYAWKITVSAYSGFGTKTEI